MPKPLKAICPHCDASFKLKNRKAVGKQVDCPECGDPFTVKLPRSRRDDFEDDLDDEIEDDDLDFEDDEEDDDDRPRRSSSSRSRRSSEPRRRKKGKAGQIIVLGLAVVLGIGFLVAAGFFVAYLMKGGDGLDTEFLAADTELVIHVKVDELRQSQPEGARRDNIFDRDDFDFFPSVGGDLQEFATDAENIRSISFGFSGLDQILSFLDNPGTSDPPNPDNVRALLVIRFKESTPLYPDSAKIEKHDGTEFMVFGFDDKLAIWRAETQTLVLGPTASVKEAIEKGAGLKTMAKFNFVDGGQDVVFALAPQNPERLMSFFNDKQVERGNDVLNSVAPDSVKGFYRALLEGEPSFAVGMNVDTDLHVKLQFQVDTDMRATDLEADLEKMNAWAWTTLDEFKTSIPTEVRQVAQAMIDNREITRKGPAVTYATFIPQELEDEVKRIDGSDLVALMFGFRAPFPGVRPPRPVVPGGGVNDALIAAKRTQDANNLKQIGLALHNYHDAHGELPTGIVDDATGLKLLSWRVQLLPYLEQAPLYEQFNLTESWNSPHNRALLSRMPDVLRSPMVEDLVTVNRDHTSYVTFTGGTLLGDGSKKFADVTQGMSNTIAVVQAGGKNTIEWTRPETNSVVTASSVPGDSARSGYGGFNVLLADGSIRWMTPSDLVLYRDMLVLGPGGGTGGTPVVVTPSRGANLGFSEGSTWNVPTPKVVFKVSAYSGSQRQSTVAKNAVNATALTWANTAKFAYSSSGEVHVSLLPGALQKGYDPSATKAALENGGFTVTEVSVDNSRNRNDRDPSTIPAGSHVVVHVPPLVDNPNANEVLRRQVAIALAATDWVIPGTGRVSASEGRIEFVAGERASAFFLRHNLESKGITVDRIKLAGEVKSREVHFTMPGLATMPNGLETVHGLLDAYAFIDNDATNYEDGELTIRVLYEAGADFQPLDASTVVKNLFASKGLPVGPTRLGVERIVERPMTLGATLVAGPPIKRKSGRGTRESIMLRITPINGSAVAATAYGNVKIEHAVDQVGRPLVPMELPETLDYSAKFLVIEPANKFIGGVHVYVIFEKPKDVVTSGSVKGTLQMKTADGRTIDVPFNFTNVGVGT